MTLRIGIGMNFHTAQEGCGRAYLDIAYYKLVQKFGAIAVPLLPTDDKNLVASQLDRIDAVMMTGGLDLDSCLWQAPLHDEVTLTHPHRTASDLLLYNTIQKKQLPLLAICLGMQLINVAHGGCLMQHLPDHQATKSVAHGGGDNGVTKHTVTLQPNAKMRQWFKNETISINSMHHQGVTSLADGLQPAAIAADGVIEAFETNNGPFMLAVQWHPERIPDDIVTKTIMTQFLKAVSC